MGNHILLNLYGISFALLDDLEGIEEVFEQAVQACGATVLNRFFHRFQPQGITIVYTLAESHLSIHTFPERGCCAIDVYTCGSMNSKAGMEVLIKYFDPENFKIQEVERLSLIHI